jgi:hypothetical protein
VPRPFWYILDDACKPVPVTSQEWDAWRQANQDGLAVVAKSGTDPLVSTVFLGYDANGWDPSGPPLLYETAVYRDGTWEELERYATREEAQAGHARHKARVFGPSEE